MIRRKTIFKVLFLASIALPNAASGAVPMRLVQQGRLLTDKGVPVQGSLTMTFSIYDSPAGGTALWSESQSVAFDDDGYFVVQLGSNQPLSTSLFNGDPRFLGLTVGSDAEMMPREELISVPYVWMANDAVGDIHPTSVTVGGTQVIDNHGQWVGPISPKGPKGDKGDKGDKGVPGDRGPPGRAAFYGIYMTLWNGAVNCPGSYRPADNNCKLPNPLTGSCSCPPGSFGVTRIEQMYDDVSLSTCQYLCF